MTADQMTAAAGALVGVVAIVGLWLVLAAVMVVGGWLPGSRCCGARVVRDPSPHYDRRYCGHTPGTEGQGCGRRLR